ncbi:conjugal transfer protein TrbM [Luteimonas sp. Y-2-2-4F]|nr:TrbM/KikA/MpfK family conjugal transfer protein [Luteimonas sp. Y-2-2-4F]MCD9032036.1 conjugal transfer protein TrbM [Luteimonas sp. Y-2-2-4F]
MKRHRLLPALFAACVAAPVAAQNGMPDLDQFTGDTKLSCEAILCLSTGSPPNQCMPALTRYFDINPTKLADRIRERKNFLNICPSANADNSMRSLTDAIARGAGRCDADALNSSQRRYVGYRDDQEYYIDNNLPSYCQAYYNHPYTDLTQSRYVGEPRQGGRWVSAQNYETALQTYNEEIADRERYWETSQSRRLRDSR